MSAELSMIRMLYTSTCPGTLLEERVNRKVRFVTLQMVPALTMLYSGEGERMVIDLQDAPNTLGDALQQSKIRLFGTSSQPVVIEPDGDEEHSSQASGSGSSDTESGDEGKDSVEEEGDLSDSEAVGDGTGRSQPRQNARHLPAGNMSSSASAKGKGKPLTEVEYAESDSDLGEDLAERQQDREALDFMTDDEEGEDWEVEVGEVKWK